VAGADLNDRAAYRSRWIRDYWAKDTIIPAIQHSCLEAWARLFDIPLVKAVNF